MNKTIFITGSTDGIGLAAAKMLTSLGHQVLLHGRNPDKLKAAEDALAALTEGRRAESYLADLSRMADVDVLSTAVASRHQRLDVLINNAGVYRTGGAVTRDGLDTRFAVNTIAPYLLTKRLMPLLAADARVVNVSSAAQAPVDLSALRGGVSVPDDAGYAQSKLAIAMWSYSMASSLQGDGPTVFAINPGSMLGTKMVKNAYGVAGGDISIGAKILTRAALADEFAAASGRYFDNDVGQFAAPHPNAQDPRQCAELVAVIEAALAGIPH